MTILRTHHHPPHPSSAWPLAALTTLPSLCQAVLSAVVGPIVFFGSLLPRYLFFSTNRYERVNSKIFASLLLLNAGSPLGLLPPCE